MNVAAKPESAARRSAGKKDLVFGLGKTGLSIARYLVRKDIDGIYIDSRLEPPGVDELEAICPGSDIYVGETPQKLIRKASRIIVSPGVADSDPFLDDSRCVSQVCSLQLQKSFHVSSEDCCSKGGRENETRKTPLNS